MKKLALPLLGALGLLYGKCGYLAPIPMGYSYGTKIIPATTNSIGDATGVCAWGSISLHEYNFTFLPVRAKNTAIGFDGSKVVLTGGVFDMGEVNSSNGNAYAFYSAENLSLTLGTNYGLFGKTHSKIISTMVQAQNNAYGMYATKDLNIIGSGEIIFEAITSKVGVANGLYAQNNLQLEKNNIHFKSITSGNSAVGMGGYDVYTEENTAITFDEISATNNAYGIKAYSFYVGNFSLNIGKITSSNATAIGIEMGNEMLHNYYASSFNSSTSLHFGEISGVNAIGLYTSGSGLDGFDFREEKVFLKFDRITASSGDAIGFYNNNASSTLSLVGGVLDFGNISSTQGNAYGFYNTSGSMDIKLSNSTLSLSLQGKNALAFKSEGKGSIDLEIQNSTINLNGNGGSIQYLNASGKNYIDLSGRSHNALSSRTSSRTLSIHSLDSRSIMFGSTLTFGLYHAPDKGIADSITIDNLGSYDGGINLDVVYEPSSTPIHSQASQYSLLLKADKSVIVENFSSNSNVGTSVARERVEDITTLIHRYDQGNVSYYYIDNSEKQIHTLNSQALLPSLYAMEGMLASYFYTLDSVNKRIGDLRAGYDDSGLWGRMSFGGIDTGSGDLDMSLFQVGGDIQISKENKHYFFGLAVGYSPLISSNDYISNLSNLDLSIYAGVFLKNGFYYDTQLKLNYLQVETQANQWLGSANFSQWMMNYSNELGYRLSFGSEGGFYLQPSATLNISLLPPISYSQEVNNGNPLEVSSDVLMTFQSLVGGKMGYRFGGVERGFDLFLGAYYDFKGFVKGDMKFKTLGSNQEELSSELKGKFRTLGALQFELGSNIEINKHSKLYFDIDFGFGDVLHTIYKLNASYRFTF